MDEVTLLERPGAVPSQWLTPDETLPATAVRGLMLHRLCTLSHRMRALAVKEIFSEHGLDLRDWMVLLALDELGWGTQRDITKTCNLDKVAVNRAAARLKRQGMLASRPNARDGRSHHLELSHLGRETLVATSAALAAFENKLLAQFGESENEEMSRFIDRLLLSIDPAN